MRILLLFLSLATFLSLTQDIKAGSSVVINEVLPNPSGPSTELTEWIELYNTSAGEVDLTGWQLDDIADGGTKPYVIPDGTKIAPDSFLVFEKSTTRVGLNNSYDVARLINDAGTEVDNFEYESAAEDVSFARSPDGAPTWIEASPTKGSTNPKPSKTPTTKKVGSNALLSEFSPAPESGKEWVEIYNPNSQQIDISGWKIDDIEGGSKPFSIPENTKINSKSYKVFYFGSKLNNSGDTLRLLNSSGKLIESYSYKKVEKGTIFAKDYSGKWRVTTTSTPGKKNIITGSGATTNLESVGPKGFSSSGLSNQTTDEFSGLPQILGIENPNPFEGASDDRPVKTQFASSKKAYGGGSFSTILIGLGLIFLGAAFGLPVLRSQTIRIRKDNES